MFADVAGWAFWGCRRPRAREQRSCHKGHSKNSKNWPFSGRCPGGVSGWPAARLNARNRLRVRGAMCRGGRARDANKLRRFGRSGRGSQRWCYSLSDILSDIPRSVAASAEARGGASGVAGAGCSVALVHRSPYPRKAALSNALSLSNGGVRQGPCATGSRIRVYRVFCVMAWNRFAAGPGPRGSAGG